ncbi:membrane transport protein-domain-containing protein [Dissophora ornata]|nr:hypothetical protein BGZ58_001056 [Dissophora ornata]KAI8597019.1 membrane transport protein-domain-containing protein [Dissophora ornata]
MDWPVLAGAAAEAVSQVLVVVACGVVLSRTGYLSQSAQKSISQVNLYFMTPCLLFTKIASTINWEQFKAFWPIPVFFLLFSSVSWVVARVGSRLLRFSTDEEKFVTASVLFSNTNSLPMALVQSLALSAAGASLLRDENDTKEQVAARGISYILFYAIFGNLVRWSYGFSLLVPEDRQEHIETSEDQETAESLEQPSHSGEEVLIDVDEPQSQQTLLSHTAVMSGASSTRTLNDSRALFSDDTDEDESEDPDGELNHDHSPFFKSVHKPKNHLRSTHMQPLSPPISGPARISTGSTGRQHRHRKFTKAILKQKASKALSRVRQVLTPPLVTAIMAVIIGLIPALHHFFMGSDSKFYAFVIHPIENCGSAAIPMILLCLGAQVDQFATSSVSSDPSSKGLFSDPARPGRPQRHRSISTPSVFPHPINDSSSSDEESQEQGWLAIPNPRRNGYGRGGIASSRSLASSSATLHSLDNEYDAPMHSAYNGASGLGLKGHRFKWLTPTAYILFSRLVFVPLVCLPAILFHPDSLSPILTMDPTFSLTLMLIVASPTAINLIQLAQVKGFFEQDMTAVLFWSYCVFGAPCILGWSLVGLWAAGR